MVGTTRQGIPSWISAAASRGVELDANLTTSVSDNMARSSDEEIEERSSLQSQSHHHSKTLSDFNLGFAERAFSAAGAAVLSAVLVNPLDVAKTRLQAQAAGVPYDGICNMACFETNTWRSCVTGVAFCMLMLPDMRCPPPCTHAVLDAETACPRDCSRYKGTLDVFYKVIRQVGRICKTLERHKCKFSIGCANCKSILTKVLKSGCSCRNGAGCKGCNVTVAVGIYLPCYDIFRNYMEEFTSQNAPSLTPYVPLVAGSVARSLACVTCYPVELARTRMQGNGAFKEAQGGVKPSGVFKTLSGIVSPVGSGNSLQNMQSYRLLWTGLGAQLARDVPFSAICWSTLEPIRRRIFGLMGDEISAANILGANFCAGFFAGSLAAAATCPLDVAKTRRQIEERSNPSIEDDHKTNIARNLEGDGGMKGLFTGVGPRVARAGPSVGIVVTFYEVVKYALHQRHLNQ
ncbi:unnamed protein product [Camellia sinensis]